MSGSMLPEAEVVAELAVGIAAIGRTSDDPSRPATSGFENNSTHIGRHEQVNAPLSSGLPGSDKVWNQNLHGQDANDRSKNVFTPDE